MKKIRLSDCVPGQIIRMRPDTVDLEVHFHLNGQTRLILGKEGFWRDSKEKVYTKK